MSFLVVIVLGPSNLTVDALARHEAQHICDQNSECDAQSVGLRSLAKSNCTWASQWTECTNATFGNVLRRFSMSNSAQHKEVCEKNCTAVVLSLVGILSLDNLQLHAPNIHCLCAVMSHVYAVWQLPFHCPHL